MNLGQIVGLFASAGATRLYAKGLSENDNSKNQVYVGSSFEVLNLFPIHGVTGSRTSTGGIFKASLQFSWLLPSGEVVLAPDAKFILYPQYPEVRFSGFLKRCGSPPSALMAERMPGRMLFFGIRPDRTMLGFVIGPGEEAAAEISGQGLQSKAGVFTELALPLLLTADDSRAKLLHELRRIHEKGWITAKQLAGDGSLRPCNAPQCGGFTLEAELGISKNSRAEPDFLGWEIKQHSVPKSGRVDTGLAITLMTPEPSGGIYKDLGVREFLKRFGYKDKKGREDRTNFGGIHRVGFRHPETLLTLVLRGFNAGTRLIEDFQGALELVTDNGEVAASWSFEKLLDHWSRKHMRAAYIPSQCRKADATRQYKYGPTVRLAERTDSLRLLSALADGAVYYDPGIKLEQESGTGTVKKRSQYRISSRSLGLLYGSLESVDVSPF